MYHWMFEIAFEMHGHLTSRFNSSKSNPVIPDMPQTATSEKLHALIRVFFQNGEIFVQLDELEEFDKTTHAWIGFNYSLTQAKKTF